MGTITLNLKQQRRVDILTRLDAGALGVADAAEMLGVTSRHARRLRARFREKGMAVAIHGNTGRRPANATDMDMVEQVVALAGPAGKYHDFNVSHLHDDLDEHEHIQIARPTLDRLLKQKGVRKQVKQGPPRHRRRRERRPAEGMLLQIDGSPFAWLEDRGPKSCLMGAIDDATGKILDLQFHPTEDQRGYLLMLRGIAQRFGLPMSIYHDRHTILRSPKEPTLEEQLAGKQPMSQIQRIMDELGIESIAALSPQAKGRVERLWRTLQDRLTKELRLASVTNMEDANAFLPGFIGSFNLRFGQEPQDPHVAWVPLPDGLDIPYFFSIRETRTVRSDHCVKFLSQILQLLPGPKDPSLVNETVSVHIVPEGDIYLYHGKQRIAYQSVAVSPAKPSQPAGDLSEPANVLDPEAKTRQRAWLFGFR